MAVSRSRSVPGFRPFTGVLVIIFHVVPASIPETNQPDHTVAMVDSDRANPAFARLQDRGHCQGLWVFSTTISLPQSRSVSTSTHATRVRATAAISPSGEISGWEA